MERKSGNQSCDLRLIEKQNKKSVVHGEIEVVGDMERIKNRRGDKNMCQSFFKNGGINVKNCIFVLRGRIETIQLNLGRTAKDVYICEHCGKERETGMFLPSYLKDIKRRVNWSRFTPIS